MFEELGPLVLPLLKKKGGGHIKLGQAGIVDHFLDLSIQIFSSIKKIKGNGESNEIKLKHYINA